MLTTYLRKNEDSHARSEDTQPHSTGMQIELNRKTPNYNFSVKEVWRRVAFSDVPPFRRERINAPCRRVLIRLIYQLCRERHRTLSRLQPGDIRVVVLPTGLRLGNLPGVNPRKT